MNTAYQNYHPSSTSLFGLKTHAKTPCSRNFREPLQRFFNPTYVKHETALGRNSSSAWIVPEISERIEAEGLRRSECTTAILQY